MKTFIIIAVAAMAMNSDQSEALPTLDSVVPQQFSTSIQPDTALMEGYERFLNEPMLSASATQIA